MVMFKRLLDTKVQYEGRQPAVSLESYIDEDSDTGDLNVHGSNAAPLQEADRWIYASRLLTYSAAGALIRSYDDIVCMVAADLRDLKDAEVYLTEAEERRRKAETN